MQNCFTSKDLSILEDQLGHEAIANHKAAAYAESLQDPQLRALAGRYAFDRAPAGAVRNETLRHGLDALNALGCARVVILDAVRPLVTPELLDEYLPRDCVLDLNGLSFMDSSGIAVIIRLNQRMKSLGGRMWIENPAKQPLRVLDAAGIDRLVPVATGKS